MGEKRKILIIITHNGKLPDWWHWKGREYLRPWTITSVNSSSIAVPSGEGAEEGTGALPWKQVNYSEQDICQCAFTFLFFFFWFEEWIFAGRLWFQRFISQNCWITLGPHRIHKLFTLRLHRLNRVREVSSGCRLGLEATKSRGKNSHRTTSTPGNSPKFRVMLRVPQLMRRQELSVCAMQAEFVAPVLIDPCQSIHEVVSHWLCCIPTAPNGGTECTCRRSHQAHYFSVPITFVIKCQDWITVFISSAFTWLLSWVSTEEGHEQHQHKFSSQKKSVKYL